MKTFLDNKNSLCATDAGGVPSGKFDGLKPLKVPPESITRIVVTRQSFID
jgi:hypothetical protein